jgi:hypothetical protein
MSFNSLFNSPLNINSSLMLFSSVFSHYGSEQHLDSVNVFSPLFLLSFKLAHNLIVDSPCTETEFEELLFHFAYRSNPSSPLPSNNSTDSPTSSEEFEVFAVLSLHVFSFSHIIILCTNHSPLK